MQSSPCFPKGRYQIQNSIELNVLCGGNGEAQAQIGEAGERLVSKKEGLDYSRQGLKPVMGEEISPTPPFPPRRHNPAPSSRSLSKLGPGIFLISGRW